MKGLFYGFTGMFLFFLLVGLFERWGILDPILDFIGFPK